MLKGGRECCANGRIQTSPRNRARMEEGKKEGRWEDEVNIKNPLLVIVSPSYRT